MGTFIASVFGLCAAVGTVYPDKLSAPKTYPDGLEAELGGKGALLVSALTGPIGRMLKTWIGKEAGRGMVNESRSAGCHVNTIGIAFHLSIQDIRKLLLRPFSFLTPPPEGRFIAPSVMVLLTLRVMCVCPLT
jgi:hypothetical protein